MGNSYRIDLHSCPEPSQERRRQIEDATRGDRTVMIVCLHHKADERDVYEFFSKNAGKVRDVQIIRDARTGLAGHSKRLFIAF